MGWTATTVVTGHAQVSCDSLKELDDLFADLDARADVAVTRDDGALRLVATVVQTNLQSKTG